MKIRSFDLYQTEIPFRSVFRHAKHSRRTSSSIFIRCTLEDGTTGYGESLPREYVTGESQDSVYSALSSTVLHMLLDRGFASFAEVEAFCSDLYEWLGRGQALPQGPHGALCCAVELALLDAYGRHFSHSLMESGASDLRCSGVISSGTPLTVLALALRYRMVGMPAIKLKVAAGWDQWNARIARGVFGNKVSLRADANAGWSLTEALEMVPRLQRCGVDHIEQPFPVGQYENMRRLHDETGVQIIVDEDLCTMKDAERLIDERACQGINIRVSKCGGFFQSLRIAEMALRHGMLVQVGCQVGETALLSAAGLALARRIGKVAFLEGCFGTYLLREDILPPGEQDQSPSLRFGRGGMPPEYPWQAGVGVAVNHAAIERFAVQSRHIEKN